MGNAVPHGFTPYPAYVMIARLGSARISYEPTRGVPESRRNILCGRHSPRTRFFFSKQSETRRFMVRVFPFANGSHRFEREERYSLPRRPGQRRFGRPATLRAPLLCSPGIRRSRAFQYRKKGSGETYSWTGFCITSSWRSASSSFLATRSLSSSWFSSCNS